MFYIWYYTINNAMENDNTVFQNPSLEVKQVDPDPEAMPADFLTQPPVQAQGQTQAGSLSQNFPNPEGIQRPQVQPTLQNPYFHESSPGGSFGKFKKIFSILIGLFVVVGLVILVVNLLHFGSNNSSSGQVTLTYWGLFEDNNVMQGIISDFEAQNPNIKVEYTMQDINQYKDRLTTRISNGTGPDIFRFHNTWYPMLKSYLLPLPSQTISPEEFGGVFYPVVQKDLVKNGAIYGIPLSIDTLALFVNTQLFQAAGLTAPTNWNDFVNDARTITVKDPDGKIRTAGAAMGTYNNVTHAPDIMSLLFLENGVDMGNFSALPDRVNGALTFYTSFAVGDNAIWDSSLDPSQLAFAKGNLGMFFGYTSDYFAIKKFNPSLAFQIVPVPQLPNQNVTMASYWVEGVSVKSTHQKESLLFMKFLARKDTEQKLYAQEAKQRDFGAPFARVDLADGLKTNPLIYPFVLQAQTAASSPFVDSTFDNGLNKQLNTYLGNVINTFSQAGGNANQDASSTFITSVSQILQQYSW
jgi:multiple sugar transport system substrate-binding protein